MKKVLTSILGILLATGLAVAEQPEGKGKETPPGPVQVLANQQSIGTFLQDSTVTGALRIAVLSSTGYRFDVLAHAPSTSPRQPGELATNSPFDVLYTDAFCLSTAYVKVRSGVVDDTDFSVEQGFVFKPRNFTNPTTGRFYVPAGSIPAPRNFLAGGPS